VPRHCSLPDDIESLKRLIIEQRAALLSRDLQIEKLKIELARLRRLQFGRSSEQLSQQIAQLEFTLEELEASETELAMATVPPHASVPTERSKPVRRPLPQHLPRETFTHESACTCPECGGTLRSIGEDVAEVLEYVPGRFKVLRHVRPKFSCDACTCGFWPMPATDSGASRAGVPVHAGPPFRSMPA